MAEERQLRVFYGPDDERGVPLKQVRNNSGFVEIQLNDLLATLADANASNRKWLDDFRDEPVTVSVDLYEVISAYRALKKSA